MKNITIILSVLAIIVLVVFLLILKECNKMTPLHVPSGGEVVEWVEDAKNKVDSLLEQKTKLENLQIAEINLLMQYVPINLQESFKIYKEKEHWYGNDKIIGLYNSNTNIGIDFADTVQNWAMKRIDTVFIKLHAVKVLNKDGNVIAKSSFPICSGDWSDQELKQMEDSANTHFLETAKKEFPRAEKEIESFMRNAALLDLKYKEVVIEFEK